MEQHGVVPEIISEVPVEVLTVKYGELSLELGNELTPTQVQNQPTTVSWNADVNSLYTLVFIDPDAPSRAEPIFGQILHWLVFNIPGKAIDKGDDVTGYVGSGPPEGKGLHRYIYLVYKQNGKIDPAEEKEKAKKLGREYRIKFNVGKFAERFTLGKVIAGNFYQAQYDDYVPILHAKMAAAAAKAAKQ